MPSMDSVVTWLGDVRAHTFYVCEEIANRFGPLYFVWGIGASGEHKEGRALDFMTYEYGGGVDRPGPIRVQLGWNIAEYLWANRTRLGVWYVIYSRQIISVNDNSYGRAGRWNWMPDRGGPTANHMDHPHVSFLNSPPEYQPPSKPKPEEPKDWWDIVDDDKFVRLTKQALNEQREWMAAGVLNENIPTGNPDLDKGDNPGRPIGWHLRVNRNRIDGLRTFLERFVTIEANRFAQGSVEREELLDAVRELRRLFEAVEHAEEISE